MGVPSREGRGAPGSTGVSPGCHRGSLRQGGAADRPVPEGDGGARGQRQGAAAALHRGAAGPRRPRREAAPDHQQLRHHPQREPGALRHPGHQGHRPTGTSAGTGTGTASGTRPRLRESTLSFGNAPSASGMGSQLRERAPGFRNSPSASGTRPRLSSARGRAGRCRDPTSSAWEMGNPGWRIPKGSRFSVGRCSRGLGGAGDAVLHPAG